MKNPPQHCEKCHPSFVHEGCILNPPCECHSQKATWEEEFDDKFPALQCFDAPKDSFGNHEDVARQLKSFIRTKFIPLSTLHTLEESLKHRMIECPCGKSNCPQEMVNTELRSVLQELHSLISKEENKV